jgi:hypothetical protein
MAAVADLQHLLADRLDRGEVASKHSLCPDPIGQGHEGGPQMPKPAGQGAGPPGHRCGLLQPAQEASLVAHERQDAA